MAKSLILDQILANLTQIWAQKFIFMYFTFTSRHCCKLSLYTISRETNEPNLRKWQKNQFWAQIWAPKFFLWILLLLHVRHCCKLSLSAISRKTKEPNLRKWKKNNLVSGLILAPQTQIWSPKFFSWTLPLLHVRHCFKLSLHAIARKINEPNLGK